MPHSTEQVSIWLKRILGHEGGYVNDLNDPGGETKWGISRRAYPGAAIPNLTVEDAAEIYSSDYLTPLEADNLLDGVAFQLLDFAVNSGVETAKRQLQRALGVAEDGVIGPITLKAINALPESDLIMRLLAARLDYLTRLSTWPEYGGGWVRRIAQNLRYGAEDS